MKIHGLAQHEASLGLRKARSCGGISAESHAMFPFVSQGFSVGFGGSILHHTRPQIAEGEWL